MPRLINDSDVFRGKNLDLRLVRPADCTERYLSWLCNPEINRYLETRWRTQTLDSIREFVDAVRRSEDSYLFAIIERNGAGHIGNIKVGPIHPIHRYADVSYLIGERSAWGKGYGTQAVVLATALAFEHLGLHRCQAGIYEANAGSGRVLEKAGYRFEGRFAKQLTTDGNTWQDHLWYGVCAEEWEKPCDP